MNLNLQYESNRIFALNESNELLAEIVFPHVSLDKVNITRTFVHQSLRGQGIAGILMDEAVAKINSENLKTAASCEYAKKWFSAHPEFSHLLDDN